MSIYVTGPKFYRPAKAFYSVVNRINHRIAKRNIASFPQLAIFSFDHIGLCINNEGRYENVQLQLVEQFISEKLLNSSKSAMLDIGANIGNHSVFFSRFFKNVYSFEPNPITFKLLKLNAEIACPNKNIVAFNIGLSDTSGELPFSINPANIGGTRIVTQPSAKHPTFHRKNISNSVPLNVKPLDDVCEIENTSISLIKIDVEGHELNVIKGAKNILTSQRPAILFEQSEVEVENGSSEVIDYLESLDYEFYIIERRFDFRRFRGWSVIRFFLVMLLGEQLKFVRVKQFKKQPYDMILAVSN